MTDTRFKKGYKPWNTGTKGATGRNKTSFKKGISPHNKVPIGTITTRTNRRGKEYKRRYIKTDEPNKWEPLAKYVWQKNKGELPKGMLIHHKNRNKMDDRIENLQIMTRKEHLNEHRDEFGRKLSEKDLNQEVQS